MTVPDDFGRFHDPNFRYERTYGDARRYREIPIKDARFAPSDSSDLDQMRSSNIRNIIDNVDRMNYDAPSLTSLENRGYADIDNSQIRERLSRIPEYVRDKDGRIAPVPSVRFHPNSGSGRWELEQEMNLRDLESKPTLFHEKHPFSEDFQDLHRSEDFAFDRAWDLAKEDAAEYQGHHEAPIDPDYHSPLHDMVGMYPEDLYSHLGPRYYGDGSRESRERDNHSHSIITSVRGQPDAEVMVYRTVPHEVEGYNINPDDWVSISRGYAQDHGGRFGHGRMGKGGYKLLKKKVKAKDLFSEGNSLHEYGWRGHT